MPSNTRNSEGYEHCCCSLEGLSNFQGINEDIKIGNGKSIFATNLADLKCEVKQAR
jgi:hypothetical protein